MSTSIYNKLLLVFLLGAVLALTTPSLARILPDSCLEKTAEEKIQHPECWVWGIMPSPQSPPDQNPSPPGPPPDEEPAPPANEGKEKPGCPPSPYNHD